MTVSKLKPTKKVLLSAVQPTSKLTLGNYLGAIKNWVQMQADYDCIFFVVDLHSLTLRREPAQLKIQTYQAIATYLACGINPDEAILFAQSHVSEHTELAWVLTCFSWMGELNRMTQFKDKSAKQGANVSAGLFVYPTLMAADILLYQTHLVPVGEDQKQHLEITRDLAIRMNNLFGKDLFRLPEIYTPKAGARIMSLQDPNAKMSKSDTDTSGTIFLDDSDDDIRKKIKRAVTDAGTEVTYEEQKPGVRNLINIQSAILGQSTEMIVSRYAGKQYGHLKMETADIVASAVAPIRTRCAELLADQGYLESLLHKGAQAARERAQETLSKVYERMGLIAGRY